MRWAFTVLPLLLLAGCWTPITLSRAELERVVHDSKQDHVMYRGSDKKYHYLDRVQGEKRTKFRVPRGEFEPPDEFAIGEMEPYQLWSPVLGR
jgi:hypothetical protein